MKNGHPSWGYVYLTNLLKNSYFNVVFTTNFDDLINEACFLYSEGLRPLVAAHDSAISSIRVTSARPKIIKLHGDFLYDNIKNTVRELDALNTITQQKLRQFAQEYGLVVIGYGGRDRSVVDTLEVLLRSDEYFPHGIYWCTRPGDEPTKRLKSLLARERVYLVEIDGFDEFMAALHRTAGLPLPEPLANPFRVARERANLFVQGNRRILSHPVIAEDVSRVMRELDQGVRDFAELVPPNLMAFHQSQRGDLEGALQAWREVLDDDPNNDLAAYEIGVLLIDLKRSDQLKDHIVHPTISKDPTNLSYFLLFVDDHELLQMSESALQSNPDDAIVRINRAIALKRLGRLQDMEVDLRLLDKSIQARELRRLVSQSHLRAGVAALRQNKEVTSIGV